MGAFAAAAAAAVDRFVEAFSPRRGLIRHYYRQGLARAYEAASPRDGWRPRRGGASANADHFADAAAIRAKARSLVQNVPYIAAGLAQKVAHVVGTGITVHWPQNPTLTATWNKWCKVCDADGALDFAGLVRMAYQTMDVDGEVLVRLRWRRPQDNLPCPLQLQLLEVDWIDTSRAQGAAGGNVIINGIEYDLVGRKVAYWLWDQHPGDSTLRRGVRMQSRRVPAENIIHVYAPERPGQGRGFSRLAPVISRVRDLQLYEDAEIARKNLEARLSVLVSGDAAGLANPPPAIGGQTNVEAARLGDLGQLASGGITQLPPGMNVSVVAPTPAPGHVEYVKYQLHIISAGWGPTYEMMTGDMREVNFSSARVRMLQFRRVAEADQWLVLIPTLIDAVAAAFVQGCTLAEGREPAGADQRQFTPPKWDYVNPGDEIDADVAEVAAGMSTLSEKIRRRGDDPEKVFAEADKDAKRLGLGGAVDLMLMLLSRGKTTTSQQPAAQPAGK